MTEALKKTVLNDWHRENGGKMVPFGGWDMPVNYKPGILEEHLATRKAAGLFDVSHMGRFQITGDDALPFLQHTLTNDASELGPGNAQYTIIPNETGGAVDDSYLYQRGDRDYLLVVNASNAEKDFNWLSQFLPRFPEAKLQNITEELFMASLQGPQSPVILESVLPDSSKPALRSLKEAKRNAFVELEVEGHPVLLSRTGYTGEPLSFEFFTPRAFAVDFWTRTIEAGRPLGLLPVGLGARDSLRLEAGYPLYGHEFGEGPDGKDIPIFAVPLSRFAVSFSETKRDFVGHAALEAQSRESEARRNGDLASSLESWVVPKRFFPITVTGKGIARQGHEVTLANGGEAVGHVSSGTMIPYWKFTDEDPDSSPSQESAKRAIGMAYVRADLEPSCELEIHDGRRTVSAIIMKRHLNGATPPYARPILG
jgi:aminomethyltransferase